MSNSITGTSVSAGTTGRYIVLFSEGSGEEARRELQDRAGVRALSLDEYDNGSTRGRSQYGAANVFLDELGVAVVDAPPESISQMRAAVADSASPIEMVEPERILYASNELQPIQQPTNGRAVPSLALPEPSAPAVAHPAPRVNEAPREDYLQGYRAAFRDLVDQLLPRRTDAPLPVPVVIDSLQALATDSFTWGLVATRVAASHHTGHGIRVAVLDTGFDLNHPDFAGRAITHASFIPGEDVQDGNGHGTHTAGTACGPRLPPSGQPRYGVACEAELFVGKVLSNAGSGADAGILAGIAWAVRNRCEIISMSLGSPVSPGEPYSQIYERIAQRAVKAGSVIVAAAGNESNRPGLIAPVGHPANAPSIVAVSALDIQLLVAVFSCGGINPGGGEVNVAGPGVDVFSSWPMPLRYRSLRGTSMATPHVAGILALYAQQTGLRGMDLVNHVLTRSRRLFPVRDFGWGLIQAP
jgi:subtilisin family serine protease